MHNHCFIAAIACNIVFKSLADSDVIGVWWVNPAQPSQILHVGQYHLRQDAWYDVRRRCGHVFCNDSECANSRPALGLNAAALALIRAQARQYFARHDGRSHAA